MMMMMTGGATLRRGRRRCQDCRVQQSFNVILPCYLLVGGTGGRSPHWVGGLLGSVDNLVGRKVR